MLYYFVDWFSATVVPAAAVLIIFGVIQKAGARKTLLMLLFTVYLAVALDIAGICDVRFLSWNPEVSLVPLSDLLREGPTFQVMFQYAANIIMFVPFGFLLPAVWRSFRRLWPTLAAGAAASLFIELNQLFLFRLTALDDLIMNVLGTLCGYLLMACFAKKSWKKDGAVPVGAGARDAMELLTVAGLVFIAAIFIKNAIGRLIYSMPMFK